MFEEINIQETRRFVHTLKARYAKIGMKFASRFLNEAENKLSKENLENTQKVLNNFHEELAKFLKKYDIIIKASNKLRVDDGLAIPVNKLMDLIKSFTNLDDFHFHIYQNYFLSDLLLKINRYKGLAEDVAKEQGKKIVWKSEGDKIIVDAEKYNPFVHSLIHVFRNMVDHGIEKEEERIEKSKTREGSILIESKVER